jgi:hypothetical protein
MIRLDLRPAGSLARPVSLSCPCLTKKSEHMETLQEGLVLLKQKELLEIHGGCPILVPILVGLAIAAGTEIINDWDNFKAGLLGKPEIRQ